MAATLKKIAEIEAEVRIAQFVFSRDRNDDD
mgnify:CR=1 FL=1